MRCPDCDFDEMEAEDQSTHEFGILAKREKKPKVFVHIQYFCPNCKEYWLWSRIGGLRRA